jgi:hypothetical protein
LVISRTATACGPSDLGFKFWQQQESFIFFKISSLSVGTHSDSYSTGTRGSFPLGKAVGAWGWLLPSSSAKVKNGRSYTSVLPMCPHDVHMIRFTSSFYLWSWAELHCIGNGKTATQFTSK